MSTVGTINHSEPLVQKVAAALADAAHVGGLSSSYYRRADDVLAALADALDEARRARDEALADRDAWKASAAEAEDLRRWIIPVDLSAAEEGPGEWLASGATLDLVASAWGPIREVAVGAVLLALGSALDPERAGRCDCDEDVCPQGAELIAAERARQAFDAEHDDDHRYAELAIAAAEIAIDGTDATVSTPHGSDAWGLVAKHGHASPRADRVRALTVAGALIAAEIDRELRARVAGETRG